MRVTLGRLAILMLLALLAGPMPARAEPQVVLTSLDGATRVEGELLNFDGETYTLRTGFGVIAVPGAQVTCSGEGCPDGASAPLNFDRPADITLEGSNLIGDGLIPALADGFAQSLEAEAVRVVGGAPGKRVYRIARYDGKQVAAIPVTASGTETGFAALADGSAVYALAARRIAEGGEAGLPDLRGGPAEHIIALDGLVAVVHPDNPVRDLTLDQIAEVIAGRITDWSELGGVAQPINLYLPGETSGTLKLFDELVLKPRALQFSANAERFDRLTDLSDLVAIDPNGFGITGFAAARAARMLAIRQSCDLVSEPNSFAIKTEEYPLARRLYVYGDPAGQSPQARAFLDFALSDTAQPLIADAGFVDRSVEAQGIAVQGARLANSITSREEFSLPVFREMLTELQDAERLSFTFRFNRGSSDLETRSQSEAERFARLLASGAYAGKEVLLVGFTDAVGKFNVNRSLALNRAESVLTTLTAAVPEGALASVEIHAQSYGELTPVGCNDTAEGRELNRRVEVWVRDQPR